MTFWNQIPQIHITKLWIRKVYHLSLCKGFHTNALLMLCNINSQCCLLAARTGYVRATNCCRSWLLPMFCACFLFQLQWLLSICRFPKSFSPSSSFHFVLDVSSRSLNGLPFYSAIMAATQMFNVTTNDCHSWVLLIASCELTAGFYLAETPTTISQTLNTIFCSSLTCQCG